MANENKLVWETRDVLGRVVKYDEHARKHIIREHAKELGTKRDYLIKSVIETGSPIYASKDFVDRELYFGLGAIPGHPDLYLSVVVEHNSTGGEVVTAFPQRKIGGVNPGGLVYVDLKI